VEAALLADGVEVCWATGLLPRRTETGGPGGFEKTLTPPVREGLHMTIEMIDALDRSGQNAPYTDGQFWKPRGRGGA
jgi:hypothetical protein